MKNLIILAVLALTSFSSFASCNMGTTEAKPIDLILKMKGYNIVDENEAELIISSSDLKITSYTATTGTYSLDIVIQEKGTSKSANFTAQATRTRILNPLQSHTKQNGAILEILQKSVPKCKDLKFDQE